MLKHIHRITSYLLALLIPAALLTACGGGGGSGGDTLTGGAQGSITLTVGKTTLPVQSGGFVNPISPLYSTTVIAKATKADGSPVDDFGHKGGEGHDAARGGEISGIKAGA